MIYTVGIPTLFKEDVSPKFVKDYFKYVDEVQFDTETTGLDCHTSDILCFQIGDYDTQFVISPKYLSEFKDFLEEKTLIGQNLKFDLKFLYKYDIFPKKVYDTFLVESVLYCGYDFHRKNLKAIAKDRLGVDLDKSIRENISKRPLSEIVEYAASDVKYLQQIKESQMKEVLEKDLLYTIHLENEFVLCLAYIEFCGFKIDTERWKIKCEQDIEILEKARKVLDDYIIENNITEYISNQLDLFSQEKKVTISWSSPKQVTALFKKLGIPVIDEKEGKDSVGEKAIAKYKKDFPIIKPYLDYKGYEKLVGTYGYTFLRSINPVTKRLHTNFTQIKNTGRLSSGGKNKETGEEFINFQNIPGLPEKKEGDKISERECFICEEGNILLVSDYSGQEQVVLANKSLDPSLLEFYDKGLADMHSFVASKMYPELTGLSLKEIKNNHSSKRQAAKTAGFAINYGGNGSTIARNNNLTEEGGDFIYESYFEAFPGLKDYFALVQGEVLANGYVLMNTITKRKCYVAGYEDFKIQQKDFTREFWNLYREQKELGTQRYEEMREKVSKWFKFKGAMERMALNYPIQGTSADITKISCIYFFRWLREKSYLK